MEIAPFLSQDADQSLSSQPYEVTTNMMFFFFFHLPNINLNHTHSYSLTPAGERACVTLSNNQHTVLNFQFIYPVVPAPGKVWNGAGAVSWHLSPSRKAFELVLSSYFVATADGKRH